MLNHRIISNLYILIFGLAFGIKFYSLCNGDVLNHYPLISPDGFDWYTEGTYLIKSFFEQNLPNLPVLRPPFFVLITLLDYLAGSKGIVLSILYSFSIVMTYFFMLWIIDKRCEVKNKNAWFLFPLAISVTVYPINFIKSYLLSDSIAVCLSLFSVFLLSEYIDKNKTYLLVMSSLIVLAGGLTQTYALLPYLIFIIIRIISVYKTNKTNAFMLIKNILFIFILFIFLLNLWWQTIEHDTIPNNFELLKFGFGMFGFYINTWGYYFLPFIIFLICGSYRKFKYKKTKLVFLSSLTVSISFSLLCLFYQWPESRFTYYFWPWILIVFFSMVIPNEDKSACSLLVVLMLIFSLLVPANPWQPTLKKLSFNYHQNWAVRYFKSEPVDRKLDKCSTPHCEGNEFLENSDQYVKSVIFTNLLLNKSNKSFK